MNLVILGVRWAHALEFFQLFTEEDKPKAEQLKRDILNRYPEDVTEGDVEITELPLDIQGSIHVFASGK